MKYFLLYFRQAFSCFGLLIALLASANVNTYSQKPTVGLLQYPNKQEHQIQQAGYVLFAPVSSTTTYLIDKCGNQVHSWNSAYKPGLSAYLLPDGSLLRTGNVGNPTFQLGGGAGGIIEKIGWDGSVVWSYKISSTTMCLHHDIIPLPNGNILAIVWNSIPAEQAKSMGRNPSKTGATVWSEKIVELAPEGTNSASIVWEWNALDHLIQDFDQSKSDFGVVADHPELININYITNPNPSNPDWLLFNSIDFNPELNQIIVSVHSFGEVWIIDHSTSTTEAMSHSGGKSGKGGDLLYRWGNPIAYNRGSSEDRMLYGQHNVSWIPKGLSDAGKIMVFNNGQNRPNSIQFSSVDIIAPPIDANGNYTLEANKPFLPKELDWRYIGGVPTEFFSTSLSSAQRLPNGNTLICEGTSGLLFEITPDKKIIWEYKNPVTLKGIAKQGDAVETSTNTIFRTSLYPYDFSGFTGRLIASGVPIELEPYLSLCTTSSVATVDNTNDFLIFPNPAEDLLQVHYPENSSQHREFSLINSLGNIVINQVANTNAGFSTIDVRTIPAGMYALKITSQSYSIVKKIIIIK